MDWFAGLESKSRYSRTVGVKSKSKKGMCSAAPKTRSRIYIRMMASIKNAHDTAVQREMNEKRNSTVNIIQSRFNVKVCMESLEEHHGLTDCSEGKTKSVVTSAVPYLA